MRAWNRQAEDLWGLRADEVLGQHFLNLDIGFPVEKLRGPHPQPAGGPDRTGPGHLPRGQPAGRPIECTVSLSQLVGAGTTRGVILVMDAVARGTAS